MADILPNLALPAISLMLWLLSLSAQGTGSRGSWALSRGFSFAFVVTSVAALPALMMAAKMGFKSLGMGFMLTLLLAALSAVLGLASFAIGYVWGGAAWDKEQQTARRSASPSSTNL